MLPNYEIRFCEVGPYEKHLNAARAPGSGDGLFEVCRLELSLLSEVIIKLL